MIYIDVKGIDEMIVRIWILLMLYHIGIHNANGVEKNCMKFLNYVASFHVMYII
jgi:hypothetical protein